MRLVQLLTPSHRPGFGHKPALDYAECPLICVLFHQSFKVLFGTLLTMKADTVMNRNLASAALLGELVILLGLLDPFPGRPSHRGPFPWTRSSSGTTRPPPAATSSAAGCGR